jgi:hypothetical protein
MTKLKSLYIIIALVVSFSLGVLFSDTIRREILHQPIEKRMQSVLNLNRKEYISTQMPLKPPLNDTSATLDIAHQYSVRYRTNPGTNFCDIDANGMACVDPKTLGFWDLSLVNAIDIVSSMNNIRRSLRHAPPDHFRVINGLNHQNESVLIIVGLDPISKQEIVNTNSLGPLVYVSANPIDCPVKCDFTGSDIILSGSRIPNDACY